MKAQIISFNCNLKTKNGILINSTYNKDVLTSINDDQAMLLGLARGLQGLKKGDRRSVYLKAEEAYGFYDPNKIIYFPKRRLPKHVRSGQTVTIVGKSGTQRVYKVLTIHSDMVSLDGNHPLAGQDLVFEIETLAARDATYEEIQDATNAMSTQLLH